MRSYADTSRFCCDSDLWHWGIPQRSAHFRCGEHRDQQFIVQQQLVQQLVIIFEFIIQQHLSSVDLHPGLKVEAIVYQSVWNSDQTPIQQITNLSLSGISTLADAPNTDGGKLYGTLSQISGVYTLSLYSDEAQVSLVAQATSATLGQTAVVGKNGSGLAGTVNFAQYQQADPLIYAVCVLAGDNDIPLNNLQGLSDFDPVVGFAQFHILAFNKIKEVVTSRYRSVLWNPTSINTNAINGALGAYDLSRVLNWDAFREAAAHYAFYLLCERNTVEPGSIFDRRGKESYGFYKDTMQGIDVAFDLNQTRTVQKDRAATTFKIGRA